MNPRVTGFVWLPSILVTRSPCSVTSRLQASGQSRGQVLGTTRAASTLTAPPSDGSGLLPPLAVEPGLPAPEGGEHGVVGGVGRGGGDRDQALPDGVDVGHLVAQPPIAALLDPVVRAAARVEALEDGSFVLPPPLHGDGRAHGVPGGNVDVEQRALRQPLL